MGGARPTEQARIEGVDHLAQEHAGLFAVLLVLLLGGELRRIRARDATGSAERIHGLRESAAAAATVVSKLLHGGAGAVSCPAAHLLLLLLLLLQHARAAAGRILPPSAQPRTQLEEKGRLQQQRGVEDALEAGPPN